MEWETKKKKKIDEIASIILVVAVMIFLAASLIQIYFFDKSPDLNLTKEKVIKFCEEKNMSFVKTDHKGINKTYIVCEAKIDAMR